MIEIEVVERDGSGYLAPRAQRLEQFEERAPEVAGAILAVGNALRAELDAGSGASSGSGWAMDGLTLSFELALEAEAGVVIARAKTTATFTVEISWKRESTG
jgi:hypothetical protein